MVNQGGEMVEATIHQADPSVPVKLVHASRGKQTRAEPIAARYEKGEIHHVGNFSALEDEQCLWVPGDDSPNRMDALVWALSDLMLGAGTTGLLDFYAKGLPPAGKAAANQKLRQVYEQTQARLSRMREGKK